MNPKTINAMAARIARLEALLEDKDQFKTDSNTTYGGLQYEGSQFNIGTDDTGAIFDLQQRTSELELLAADGSRDTSQSGALDAGQAVGDDGIAGTGAVSTGTANAGVAFLGSTVGVSPVVAGTNTPFTLTAVVDSDNAWSGTGYTAPSDGYYLCIGDVSGQTATPIRPRFSSILPRPGARPRHIGASRSKGPHTPLFLFTRT